MPASVLDSPAGSDGGGSIATVAAELVACGSIEMGAETPEDALRIAELLPAGTPVYVNHLPRHELPHMLAALVALREAGLEPVPHIAARRVASRTQVRAFLDQAVRVAGVAKALLIAGDVAAPLGPYGDGVALIRDGVLADTGLQQVGLPGYPEGHPQVLHAGAQCGSQPKASTPRAATFSRLRRHAILFRASPHRRVLCRSHAPCSRRSGLCRPGGTDHAAPTAQIRAALRRVRLVAGTASRRHACRAAFYPRRSERPAHGHCAPCQQWQRQQRGRCASVQLWRRGAHRRLDERANHGWPPLSASRRPARAKAACG